MEKHLMAAQKIKSTTGYYSKIIQVNTPVRFYWLPDGTFDGIEIGPIPEDTTRYQHRLIMDVVKQCIGFYEDEDVKGELE